MDTHLKHRLALQMAYLLHQEGDKISRPIGSYFWDELPTMKRTELVGICENVIEALDLDEYMPLETHRRPILPPRPPYTPKY